MLNASKVTQILKPNLIFSRIVHSVNRKPWAISQSQMLIANQISNFELFQTMSEKIKSVSFYSKGFTLFSCSYFRLVNSEVGNVKRKILRSSMFLQSGTIRRFESISYSIQYSCLSLSISNSLYHIRYFQYLTFISRLGDLRRSILLQIWQGVYNENSSSFSCFHWRRSIGKCKALSCSIFRLLFLSAVNLNLFLLRTEFPLHFHAFMWEKEKRVFLVFWKTVSSIPSYSRHV